MRVLLDTNVVLDVLLARKPFVHPAAQIFGLVEQSRIEGFLGATTITTVEYLLTQSLPRATAYAALHRLLEFFEIAPVNRAVLEEALQSKIADFEDAVLEQAGRLVGVEAILTRDPKGFRYSAIKVFDPVEFLAFREKAN